MAKTGRNEVGLIDRLPSQEEVARRLADNLRERRLLRHLLKLARQVGLHSQIEKQAEAPPCK